MKNIIPLLLVSLLFAACKPADKTEKKLIDTNIGFTLESKNFSDKGIIPSEFTCDGADISPNLIWTGAPKWTKSFILTVKDPDAPSGTFVHWIIANLPDDTEYLFENFKTADSNIRQLTNDFGKPKYGGPCPPNGTHRYIFTLYALNAANFKGGRDELTEFIKAHLINQTSMTGFYSRKRQ